MKKIAIPVCLTLLLASLSTSWKLNVDGNTEETVYRLPETLIPTSYALSLTIDPTGTNFTGKVNVTFDVADNVTINQISLHFDGDYITLKSIKLNNKISCTASSSNKETSISIVNCDGGASGTDNFLYIEYSAKYSTDGYGLVKRTYMDQDESEILVETVFEPIYARRAFPCFDEPDLRARFSVEINHPTEYSVISNSPVDEAVESGENTTTTKFDPTPKISTYLLSFLISKLNKIDVKSDSGYDFKIFTRDEEVNYTKVVEKYYGVVLDKLGNYTGVNYQDITDVECYQVALPVYSKETGAFGLFEYRETDILDNGDYTNERTIQDIVRNLAYKLVHEWYGGDLTVSWWSDIWTNEAVATYISYIVADEVVDTYDIKNQFIAEVVRKSLQREAYSFAQPLSANQSDVYNINDITKKLDSASYEKGASILRMISYMIGGETPMKDALVQHLIERNETETDGSDLIKDLTEGYSKDGDDLNSYLQTWVFSAGYPLLTAKIVNVTGTGVEVILLSQKRFQYPTKEIKKDDTQWVIPLNSASGTNKEFYIRAEGYYAPSQENYYFYGKDSYLLFNVQSGFFYRVNYDEVMWKRIISSLKDQTKREIIDPITRAQLVDDIFNIARIGEVSYSVAFQLADSLASETDYYTWYAAFDAFSYLIGKTGDDVAEQNLKIYILDLMDKVLKESNKKVTENDTETHIDVLRRVLVTEWACKLNHSETVNSTVEQFNYFLSNFYKLEDYNLMSTVLCNGIRYSEDAEHDWAKLWDLYAISNQVHSKLYILNALGCAEDEELLNKYLLKIITDNSDIDEQDAITVFKSVFSSSVGISAATSFLDANITEVMSLAKDVWSEIIYTLAEQLYTNEHLEWLDNKLNDKIFDGFDDVKSKSRELASVNNYWTNNFQVYVKEILLNIATTTTTTTNTVPTTETTTTSKSTTDQSTTQENPTTQNGSANSVISKITIAVIMLLINFFN